MMMVMMHNALQPNDASLRKIAEAQKIIITFIALGMVGSCLSPHWPDVSYEARQAGAFGRNSRPTPLSSVHWNIP
jgi:hypothetical protein